MGQRALGIAADSSDFESLVETTGAVRAENIFRILEEFKLPIYEGRTILFVPTLRQVRSKEDYVAAWAPYLKGPVSAHNIESTSSGMIWPEPMAVMGQILDRALG